MQDKILSLIRLKGPVLPTHITSLGIDTMLAGAHLSDLASQNRVFVSHTKIGGSPVYYIKGQETRLQDLYKHLNLKDKKTFDLLKKNKILRDKNQEPITRVALRNIKDFAVPLNVQTKSGKEIFWKWYLLSDEEAKDTIKSNFFSKPKQTIKKPQQTKNQQEILEKEKKAIEEERKKLHKEREENTRQLEDQKSKITKAIEEEKNKFREELKKREDQLNSEKQKLQQQQEINKKQEQQKKLIQSQKQSQTPTEQEPKQEKPQPKQQEQKPEDKQEKIAEPPETKEKPQTEEPKQEINDEFYDLVQKYLLDKNIELLSSEIIKKKSEIDLHILVPSVVGKVEYFCKAKKKKKCNDGDLSSAFVKGQTKKLPILFLTTGDLTKKAKEMLDNEFKSILITKKIE